MEIIRLISQLSKTANVDSCQLFIHDKVKFLLPWLLLLDSDLR